MSDAARAVALLDADGGRGALKRAAEVLDHEPALRAALIAAAAQRGVALPDTAATWPGKRLLRAARARSDAAQVIRSPIARDEAFVCARCGAAVPAHGRTARDHCPWCLWSLHVDRVPGDRAADCGGLLEPIAVRRAGRKVQLAYRCVRCGEERRNQVLTDGEPPDDWAKVVALSAAPR